MDELRVKQQGGIVWMAMAVMVSTRLWLGGALSNQGDGALIMVLVEKVRACASALTLSLVVLQRRLEDLYRKKNSY